MRQSQLGNVRHQLWALPESAYGLPHRRFNLQRRITTHLPKLKAAPTEYLLIRLLQVAGCCR